MALTPQINLKGQNNWYKFCSVVINEMEGEGINRDLLIEFLIAHIIDTLIFDDKLQLINYLYFKNDNLSNFEIKLKKYIDSKIIKSKEIEGLFLQKMGKHILLIKKNNNWQEAQESDYKDLALPIKKIVTNVLPKLNNIIGFINNFKGDELVFKTKDITAKRSKGARCDQAGKKGNTGVLATLNKIIGEDKYTDINTKDIYALQLCVFEEFLLRYFNHTNHKKKIWFLGPEQASLLNIEKYQK
jgi:hypothetical protein